MDQDNRPHPLQRNAVLIPLALLATLLWGTAFPCVKVGYELFSIGSGQTASQMVFAGSRFLLAGVVTLLMAVPINRASLLPQKGDWGRYALLGVVQTTGQYLFFYIGLSNTTGTKGSILSATTAFMGVILAHFFCRGDRMNLQKAVGCLVGFSGVILINLGGDLGGLGFTFTGEGFMLLASLAQAIGAIISQKVAQGRDSLLVSGWQLAIGGGVLLAIGKLLGGKMVPISPWAWALFGYMVLLSATAFSLWTMLLKHNPVAKISIYNSLVPVFGTLSSALFLQEPIASVRSLAALALVCAGICIVNRVKPERGALSSR